MKVLGLHLSLSFMIKTKIISRLRLWNLEQVTSTVQSSSSAATLVSNVDNKDAAESLILTLSEYKLDVFCCCNTQQHHNRLTWESKVPVGGLRITDGTGAKKRLFQALKNLDWFLVPWCKRNQKRSRKDSCGVKAAIRSLPLPQTGLSWRETNNYFVIRE